MLIILVADYCPPTLSVPGARSLVPCKFRAAMPPKNDVRQKKSDVKATPYEDGGPATLKVNAMYYATLQKAWGVILANECFADIVSQDPLTMERDEHGRSSSMAPFDLAAFKNSINEHGEHTCSSNGAWVNPFWSSGGGVPFSEDTLTQVIEDNYKTLETAV